MRLVFRRARGARTLLLAAVTATLIATSFVVGLLAYGRDVVSAAARSTVASAPPAERSVLVRGAADAGSSTLEAKDSALRAALSEGIGGRRVTISAVGYSVGRQLTGPVGTAVGDADGLVFGDVMFLDDLPDHATLISGTWARPGASEVTLARAAAAVLQVKVGDRVPITDRRTDQVAPVVVAGIWEPRDLTDPYWLLVPSVASGSAPGSSSYGPIALPRDDFLRAWAADASIGWIVQPDLAGVGLPELVALQRDARPLRAGLAERVGLDGTGSVATELDRLVDRLTRADLVGRSALLTPVLLIVVLGVYALLLIAMLLTEHRRGETALIRARGAARLQIAGLAAREAALIVLPAVVLGPPLATAALRATNRLPVFSDVAIRLDPRLAPWIWAVAAAAAVVCLAAMVGPSVRRSGTYVEELATRSRPSRFAFAQRASLDLVLVGLAVLAWFQLRRYASPLAGSGSALGIDPLLVAAPTVGVLAGAVVSLRVLPRVTRLAERYVDRKHWPATMFGMWQAGRRPHAGPVLLLSLAVAVSTLAWCLLSTAERSIVDQADFGVGADLRLVEANGFAPAGRTEQLAALGGVAAVAPVSRDTLRLGPENTETAVVGIDPAVASTVVRYRTDLVDQPPARLFAGLAAARTPLPVTALAPGATTFAADIAVTTTDLDSNADFTTTLTVLAGDGHLARVPLGTVRVGTPPRRFEVELPADPRLSLVRLDVTAAGVDSFSSNTYRWTISSIVTSTRGGDRSAVNLSAAGGWRQVDGSGRDLSVANKPAGDPGGLQASVSPTRFLAQFGGLPSLAFGLIPSAGLGPVPVAATPAALHALRAKVGDDVPLTYSGTDVTLRMVAEVEAVPGITGNPSGMIADLASLSVALARARASGLAVSEHWVTVAPDAAATVADEARAVPGLRVLDRERQAATAGREPYGVGGRSALFAAGLGALLLALIGVAVDVRATARRRVGEFAVLQTMGAGSRLLARSVLAEQAFLAGLGVAVGLAVGVGVAATMAPLVILTPSADRPEPLPVLEVPWLPVGATAGTLFLVALVLSGVVAATLGRRLAIARLRIGDDT